MIHNTKQHKIKRIEYCYIWLAIMLRNNADAYISSLGYLWCRPKGRVGFLRPFGLKTGIDFAHSGLEPGTVLE